MPPELKHWTLTRLRDKLIKIGAKVVSHGRYVAFQMAEVAIPRQMFQDIFAADCGTTAAATTSTSVRRSIVMHSQTTTGGVRPNASENSQINPSTIVRVAQGDGSRPNLVSVLQEGDKGANIHVRSAAIRQILV